MGEAVGMSTRARGLLMVARQARYRRALLPALRRGAHPWMPRYRRRRAVRVADRLWLAKKARTRKPIAWPMPPSAYPF